MGQGEVAESEAAHLQQPAAGHQVLGHRSLFIKSRL
jgi:hypothetical protein